MEGLFQRSIEQKEKIMIFYIDRQNNLTQRYIDVLRYDIKTVVAYCHYRKKIRIFKREHILSAGTPSRKVGA